MMCVCVCVCVENFHRNPTVKEIWKSVYVFHSGDKKSSAFFKCTIYLETKIAKNACSQKYRATKFPTKFFSLLVHVQ